LRPISTWALRTVIGVPSHDNEGRPASRRSELKVFLQTDVTVLEVMRELSYEP